MREVVLVAVLVTLRLPPPEILDLRADVARKLRRLREPLNRLGVGVYRPLALRRSCKTRPSAGSSTWMPVCRCVVRLGVQARSPARSTPPPPSFRQAASPVAPVSSSRGRAPLFLRLSPSPILVLGLLAGERAPLFLGRELVEFCVGEVLGVFSARFVSVLPLATPWRTR